MMSQKAQRRAMRRIQLLQVPHIHNLTRRVGKHALSNVNIDKNDRRIPKNLLKQPQ